MPRCLCSKILLTGIWLKRIGGESARSFVENIICFVLPGLKQTFHFAAQAEILVRSLFNFSAVSVVFLPEANIQVSSANNRTSHSRSSSISLA